jgi:hypothetical protein
VATQAEEVTPQPGDEEQTQADVEQEQPGPDAGEEEVEDDGEEAYAPLASKMGWVPKDQFRGNPDDWKPPSEFILAGHDIQKNVSRELREVKQTLQTVSRTSASLAEQQIARERDRLRGEFQAAVDEGDAEGAERASRALHGLEQQKPAASGGADDWVQRNASWFRVHPLATARAAEICERLAAQGMPHEKQLEAVDQAMEREFPELVGKTPPVSPTAPRKAAPALGSSANRMATRSNGKRTFHDMPAAAQQVAKDMADRGVIPNIDAYVTQYWQEAERKA